MKKSKIILANWKSNKTIQEGEQWIKQFSDLVTQRSLDFRRHEVIICPSFINLTSLKKLILKYHLPIKLGVQNVSPFEEGAYTGEVAARMLKDLVDYVVIGHSERRRHFKEGNEAILEKIQMAVKGGFAPVVCVSQLKEVEYLAQNLKLKKPNLTVLYEPLFAVGSGQPDTSESANKMAAAIKKILGEKVKVLYGGSVNWENVVFFLSQPQISGAAVGGASLNPKDFFKIVENASQI